MTRFFISLLEFKNKEIVESSGEASCCIVIYLSLVQDPGVAGRLGIFCGVILFHREKKNPLVKDSGADPGG